jgi:Fe-S cluster assembly protein SufD
MSLATFIDRSRREKESWRYTDLGKLFSSSCPRKRESSVTPDSDPEEPNTDSRRYDGKSDNHPQLIFLNGVFQQKQSRFGSVPSCILMGDPETGYKLTLGEHTCLVTQPIEIVFTTDANAPREIAVKLSIDVGANGRLTLLENHRTSAAVTTLETDIALQASAKFVHGKIIANGTHLAYAQIHVAGGGYYNNFTLLRGGLPTRNEMDVRLEGIEAQASLNGAMLLRGSEHADTTIRITHAAPQCSSRQIYKTVLDGKARGVFQGKIIVAEDAQKTDGYQLSRALLLSDQAEMDAKPELEIYADDVKCSHGSTIGDLDENALFYLRARGLNESEARALLIEAFVAEMLDEIHVEEWRAIFHSEIEGWLK